MLSKLKEIAFKLKGEAVVITFHPHPRQVLAGYDSFKILNTTEEKIELLEKAGIHHMVILPFTADFASLSFDDFVKTILVGKMNAKGLVIGYDHHFGKRREGNFDNLQPLAAEYKLELFRVSPEEVGNITVSSTKIRKALLDGNMVEACELLGYCYSLEGTVVEGRKVGRLLNFPTANIELADQSKLLPARGVYAVKVIYREKEYNGMLNIGIRPTFNELHETIEVHLFGFSENAYGRHMKVIFHEFVRGEKKFEGPEALKKQLDEDQKQIMEIFHQKKF